MKETLIKYRELIRFVGLALLMLLGWVLVLAFFPGFVHALHFYLIRLQVEAGAALLRLFGWSTDVAYRQGNCLARLIMDRGAVCVGTGCSGLELFLLFAAFIVLIRGNRKKKAAFILTGLIIILILNIFRIIGLALINNLHPEYLQFNHKYTFVIIMYVVIFLLWVYWVHKLNTGKNKMEE